MLLFRDRRHSFWLKDRTEAEICRSFLATWDIRRHATQSHQPRPPLPGMERLFMTLRLLRQMDQPREDSFETVRYEYSTSRLQFQIDYFTSKLAESAAVDTHRTRLMQVATIGAVLCAISLTIFSFLPVGRPIEKTVELLAICLPLLTTALGIMAVADESSRRARRYPEMIKALERFKPRVVASRTWDSLARIATEVEEELLQEVLEWRSFVRHTEHLH
jgi:hypothetical protein